MIKIDPLKFYLEYFNDYLTIQKMAADYGITEQRAKRLIKKGKELRNNITA